MAEDYEKVFLEHLAARGEHSGAEVKAILAQIKAGRARGERPCAAELAVQAGLIDGKTASELLAKQGRKVLACPECARKYMLNEPKRSADKKQYCLACEAELGTFHGDDIAGLRILFDEGQEEALEDPLVGETIQGCKISKKLGQGGRGVVYYGKDLRLKRPVAIKFLQEGLADRGKTYVRKFVEEARAAARMEHPNIVSIYTVGRHEDNYYIIMQYVDGGSVSEKLHRLGNLWVDEAVSIVEQVAVGLAYAHKRGIIHLDIKPDNVMLNRESVAMIADFGLALRVTEGAANPGQMAGTPKYMSPEQASGFELDGRSDIYSLGITLYRMLSGRTPYSGSIAQVLAAHRSPKAIPPLPSGGDFSDDLRAVVARMVQKDRGKRYAAMAEVIEDLGRIKRGEETRALGEMPEMRSPAGATEEAVEVLAAEGDLIAAAEAVADFGEEPLRGEEPRRRSLGWLWALLVVALVAGGVTAFVMADKRAREQAATLLGQAIEYVDQHPMDLAGGEQRLGAVPSSRLNDADRRRLRETLTGLKVRGKAVETVKQYAGARASESVDEIREALAGLASLGADVQSIPAIEKARREAENALHARIEALIRARFDEGKRLTAAGKTDEALAVFREVAGQGHKELSAAASGEIKRIEDEARVRALRRPFRELVEAVERRRYYHASMALAAVDAQRKDVLKCLSDEERARLTEMEKRVARFSGKVSVGKDEVGDFPNLGDALATTRRERGRTFEIVFLSGMRHDCRNLVDASADHVRGLAGAGDTPVRVYVFTSRDATTYNEGCAVRLTSGELTVSNLELVAPPPILGKPTQGVVMMTGGTLRLERCRISGFDRIVRVRPEGDASAAIQCRNAVFSNFGCAFYLASHPSPGTADRVDIDHCVFLGSARPEDTALLVTFAHPDHGEENAWRVRVRNTIFKGMGIVFQERYMGKKVFVSGRKTTWETDYNCFFESGLLYCISFEHLPQARENAMTRLPHWRKLYEQDSESKEIDPKLVDEETGRLASDSPCVGAGEGGAHIGLQLK